jgi:cyclic pyranopterin monophosphate synthase
VSQNLLSFVPKYLLMKSPEKQFSHINPDTNYPAMVDVSDKQVTKRTARAQSIVVLGPEIMQHLQGNDIQTKKGPVFQTAIIAGTMAAKKTADLIPLCHPLALENCKVDININAAQEVVIECTATITSKTGVEMEALMGASVAALTIYDMCKAFSHHIIIKQTQLLEKTGGKHDFER